MTTFDDVTSRTWEDNQLFSVLIELTYRCNLDCFFCYNDLNLRGTPLTVAQYETFLRDLAAMNVLSVTLSGGEPIAHPDFFAIGRLAREMGFVVRVKSNGHALRGDLARRLRDELDPFVIETSLHGACAETHDRQTRVPGSFARLVDNVRGMLDLGMRVKINSTLTLWNENETAEMYALCDSLGVPLRFDLQVSPRDDGDRSVMVIAPSAEGNRHLMAVENERWAQAGDDCAPAPINAGAPSSKHCGAGSAGIAVDPYGNVYPCVQWRRAAGNLHERSIREMWGDSFDAYRTETANAVGVVGAHPRGKFLSFCPGLAELLTGSSTTVPKEMERIAEIVSPT